MAERTESKIESIKIFVVNLNQQPVVRLLRNLVVILRSGLSIQLTSSSTLGCKSDSRPDILIENSICYTFYSSLTQGVFSKRDIVDYDGNGFPIMCKRPILIFRIVKEYPRQYN